MRDTLIILVMCLAAIGVGFYLFFNGTEGLTGKQNLLGDQSATSAVPSAESPVAFTAIESGQNSANVMERKNYAARDEASYAQIWAMAHTAAEAMPPVDFSSEYVIAVFAGQKPSGGHSITVATIADRNGLRTLDIRLSQPGEGCVVTQALTSPYQIIKVPVSTNEHRAVDTVMSAACE